MSDAELFVQYKGTNLCADFTCSCGATGHIDKDFVYSIECGACHQTWVLPHTLTLIPLQYASGAAREWHSVGAQPVMD